MRKLYFTLLLLKTLFIAAQSIIPDNAFANNGIYNFENKTTGHSIINSLILPDGKIIVSGMRINSSKNDEVFISKINQDGSLDTSFANNGFYTGFQNTAAYSTNLFVLANKIIVFYDDIGYIIKLNMDGTPDNSFGVNGILQLPNNNYSEENSISGDFLFTTRENNNQTYLDKIDVNTGSLVISKLISGVKNPNGVYLRLNNKLLIKSTDNITFSHLITLIDFNGEIDTTFGNNGTAVLNTMNSIDEIEQSYDYISLDDDNNIIYGLSNDNTFESSIKKFNSNGILDTTFGNNGICALPNSLISCLKTLSNKIYFSGGSSANNAINLLLGRLNPDGQADNTFNQNGKFIYDTNQDIEWAESFNILSPNSILVAGEINSNGNIIYLSKFINSNNLSTIEFGGKNEIFFENPIDTNLNFNTSEKIDSVEIYTLEGKLIKIVEQNNELVNDFQKGVYIAKIKFTNGKISIKKLLKK